KHAKVVVVIKSCTPKELGDLTMILKDLSGTISDTVHYKVITKGGYGKANIVGAILILRNVFVFSPKPSGHYQNITLRNMVMVFPKDSVTGNANGVGESGIVGVTKVEISTRVKDAT
ncbi:GPCR kinase, partial [Tanacetum coccineum]